MVLSGRLRLGTNMTVLFMYYWLLALLAPKPEIKLNIKADKYMRLEKLDGIDSFLL